MLERCWTGRPARSSARGEGWGGRSGGAVAGREAHCSLVTTMGGMGSGAGGTRLREQCGPEQGAGRLLVGVDGEATLPAVGMRCGGWPGCIVPPDMRETTT